MGRWVDKAVKKLAQCMIWRRIAPPRQSICRLAVRVRKSAPLHPVRRRQRFRSQHEHVSTARRDWRRRLPPLNLGVASALAVGRAQRRHAAAARILQHRFDPELIEAATRSKKNGVTVEEVFGREPDVMVGRKVAKPPGFDRGQLVVRQNAAVSGAGQRAHSSAASRYGKRHDDAEKRTPACAKLYNSSADCIEASATYSATQ